MKKQVKSVSAKRKPYDSTKKQKSFKSKQNFWTPGRKILAVVAVLVGCAVIIPISINLNERVAGQKQIETYLENKYERNFEVGLPTREASGFGVEGYLQSTVFPSGQPDLEFIARTSSAGTSDDYPAAIWKQQELPILELKLKDVFGSVPQYTLEIHSINTLSKRVSGASIPTIDEITALYPEELPYTLRIKSSEAFEAEAKIDAAEKLQKIIDYLRTKNVAATIQYTYSNTEAGVNSGWSLNRNDLKEINDANEQVNLLNKFEEWRA